MADANVGITVTWSGQAAVQGVDRLEKKFDELIATVQRLGVVTAASARQQVTALNNAGNAAGRATKQFNLMRSTLQAVGAVAGLTFVANILRNVALFTIEAAGEFQSLQSQMGLATGSAREAAAATAGLIAELTKVGGDPLEGIRLFSRLTLLGVENAKEMTVAVGGISASLGLNADSISRVNLAISQIYSKGTIVRAEEFNQQLAEQIPIAAILAEGFRRQGRAELDTTTEVTRAVNDKKLAVKDFFAAFTEGSKAFINTNAVLTNVAVQYGNLVKNIRILIGLQGELTGATAAFAIVFNAVNQEITDYFAAFKAKSVEEQAAAVEKIVYQILDFVGAVEASVRFVGALGNTIVGMGRVALAVAQAIVTAFASVGAVIAGVIASIQQGSMRPLQAVIGGVQGRFVQLFRDVEGGAAQAGRGIAGLNGNLTELTDRLRDRVAQTDFVGAIRDRVNVKPGGGEDTGAAAADEKAAKELERRQSRLVEMLENLDRLKQDANKATRQALTPLQAAIAQAQDPFIELGNRFTDLRTDIEKLGLQGPAVTEALDAITAAQTRLAAASGEATAKAQAQYQAQNAIKNLGTLGDIAGIDRQIRDVVESVTIRYESEGTERIRQAEQALQRSREENANRIAVLDQQIALARTELDEDEVLRLELLKQSHMEYGTVLDSVNGAAVVAAERMRELVSSIRSGVQGSVSDLIVGLTDFNNFDFESWADGLVDTITRSIADSWSKGITDSLFSFLGLDSTQTVKTMNVGVLNANGVGGAGAGGAGGGILSSIGGLFGFGKGGAGSQTTSGNAGGGFGSFLSGIGSFFSKIPGFAKGGVIGGPTLVGEGGQKEGVLPLERVGGKLGVSASGFEGGMKATIILQAIDTQSGAAFIDRHAAQIVGALQSQYDLGMNRSN